MGNWQFQNQNRHINFGRNNIIRNGQMQVQKRGYHRPLRYWLFQVKAPKGIFDLPYYEKYILSTYVSIQWNELFENQFDKVLECEKEIFLIGDLNRDLFQENLKITWLEYMESFGLKQIIEDPSRVTDNSRTLTDHIYRNTPNSRCIHFRFIDYFPILQQGTFIRHLLLTISFHHLI